MSAPINYRRLSGGDYEAKVIVGNQTFYGGGDKKADAKEDLVKSVAKTILEMRAWVEEQVKV